MIQAVARGRWLLAAVVFSVWFSAPAQSASDFAVCPQGQLPTGCSAPFDACRPGLPASARQSCRRMAITDRCPSFTWEKCCYFTCRQQVAMKQSRSWDACLTSCNAAAEAKTFGIGSPRKH